MVDGLRWQDTRGDRILQAQFKQTVTCFLARNFESCDRCLPLSPLTSNLAAGVAGKCHGVIDAANVACHMCICRIDAEASVRWSAALM